MKLPKDASVRLSRPRAIDPSYAQRVVRVRKLRCERAPNRESLIPVLTGVALRSIRQLYARWRYRKLFRTFQRFPLTKAQVRAATSFARETLVIAGAGSGKTALLLSRAKYLLKSKRATSSQILFLAFNRKAADEIEQRSKALGLDLEARTFHGFGNSVLRRELGTRAVVFTEDHEIERFIKQHFEALAESPATATRLAEFMSRFLVPHRDVSAFKDLNEYSAFVRTIPKTLQGERVKSHGEWLIANFLWKQSVPYEYEALYRAGERTDVHKPDFTVGGGSVYIEYLGIDAAGNTAPGIDSAVYTQSMTWKHEVHLRNRTTLIRLTYQDLLDGKLLSRLESQLRRNQVELSPKASSVIIAQAEQVGYKDRAIGTLQTFLQHVRAQRLLMSVLWDRALDERSQVFLDIFATLYVAYTERLLELGEPDFSELIHGGADRIMSSSLGLEYSHVLVDEFQDIAHDRLRLIEALRASNSRVELTLVGDDWQAIYGFAGSDIGIMRAFATARTNRTRVDMGDTFRLPKSLAETATKFVMENPLQLRKRIVSTFDEPSSLTLHWDTSGTRENLTSNVTLVINRIGEPARDDKGELLVLARYRNNLPAVADIKKLWAGPVAVDTIHRAKGREADYVVVMDVIQDHRGFPSTIVDDPVLQLVLTDKDTFPHAEERRLFYVAITRARKQTHLVCPSEQPSLFALELLNGDFAVTHFGYAGSVPCPFCRVGVVAKSRFGTYRCSNSPLCKFRTPPCPECQLHTRIVGVDPLQYRCADHPEVELPMCPRCAEGRLVNRQGKYGSFVSCHLWPVTRCVGK